MNAIAVFLITMVMNGLIEGQPVSLVGILAVGLAGLAGVLVGLMINTLSDVLPATRTLSLPTCPDCEGAYSLKDYLLTWRCAGASWMDAFVTAV